MTRRGPDSDSRNGYLAPNQEPSSPVEWTLLNRGRPLVVGATETVLFEANTAGFDSFGIDVSTPVVHTFDTLNVYVRTPSGGLVHTISITGSGGQPFAEAATAAIPVLWPRYVVSAVIDSTGTATATTVNAMMMLRRTSRDA